MLGHHHVRRWSWLLVLVAGAAALAAEPNTKKDVEPPIIEEVLLQPTDFELNDVSLTDFVALLKERYRLPVVLDRTALEETGIALDAHLNCQLNGVALRSAITWALAPQAMDWTIRDDVLVLTTQASVEQTMSTMVHDVSDFISARAEKEDADAPMKRLSLLAEVVQATVLPDSWSDAGGAATIKPLEVGSARVLVVYQNRQGHESVAMVLDDLAFCAEELPAGSPKRPSNTQAKVTSFRRLRSR
jgi:hypothetical protein